MKTNKSKMGWIYKGTEQRVAFGDEVLISPKLAKDNDVLRAAKVTGLYGFITVQLSNGLQMDVDARSVTFVSRGEVQ